MEDERREEEMMEYLRAHSKKAKRLMKEARRRSIAELEEEYSDVIVAYSETKTLLDGIASETNHAADFLQKPLPCKRPHLCTSI